MHNDAASAGTAGQSLSLLLHGFRSRWALFLSLCKPLHLTLFMRHQLWHNQLCVPHDIPSVTHVAVWEGFSQVQTQQVVTRCSSTHLGALYLHHKVPSTSP